jgi:uncharacterized protein DUF1559
MMRPIIQTIVLALVLIVVGGLVLMYSGKARKQADKAKCQNNLKQIALCLHNFASANSYLPSATMRNPNLPREKQLSWYVASLPYLEASALPSEIYGKRAWDDEMNRFAAILDIPVFQCPLQLDYRPESTLFPASYVGVAGVGPDAVSLPVDDARAGIFGYDRKLSLEMLQELGGTDSRLMILETTQLRDSWISGGPATARGLEFDGESVIGKGGQFGELGRDGAYGSFADGSVRFIASSIDADLLKRIATLQGGAVSWPE